MSKVRLSKAVLTAKNYIVITDEINDGYVEPYAAEEFLTQIEPLVEHLKQLARQYTLASKDENESPNPDPLTELLESFGVYDGNETFWDEEALPERRPSEFAKALNAYFLAETLKLSKEVTDILPKRALYTNRSYIEGWHKSQEELMARATKLYGEQNGQD